MIARERDSGRRFSRLRGQLWCGGVGGPVVGCRAEEVSRRRREEEGIPRERESRRERAPSAVTHAAFAFISICTAVTTTTIVFAIFFFFFFFAFFYARDDGGAGGFSGDKPAVLSRDCSLARFRPQQRARSRFPTEAHGVVARIMFLTT